MLIGVGTATKRPWFGEAVEGTPLAAHVLPMGETESQLPPCVQRYVAAAACTRRWPPPGALEAQLTVQTCARDFRP